MALHKLLMTIAAVASLILAAPSSSQMRRGPYSVPTQYNFPSLNTAQLRQLEKQDTLVTILQNILTQEESHAINAIKYLTYNNAFVPSPCKYESGSTTLQHAINFAQVFTIITVGMLQGVAVTMARDGSIDQVRTITAIITNDAEQAGYFRHMFKKKSSEQSFPTTSVAPFLPSVLNTFTSLIAVLSQYPVSTSPPSALLISWELRVLNDTLSLAALTTKDDFSSVDEMLQFTLAAPAVMQADTYLNANNSPGTLE